jgi:hypothetical protein
MEISRGAAPLPLYGSKGVPRVSTVGVVASSTDHTVVAGDVIEAPKAWIVASPAAEQVVPGVT